MAGILILPNVSWVVKNPYVVCKQRSPSFTILETKWTLKFVYAQGIRGETIQLFLRRITPCNTPDIVLNLNASLLCIGGNAHLTKNVKFSYTTLNEVCIWDDVVKSVENKFPSTTKELNFHCSITPCHEWKKLLDQNVKTGINYLQCLPCIKSLGLDFTKMFNKESQSDVILKCGDRRFFVHKAILSARSEVFAALFRSNMRESKEMFVDIIDMEPRVLEHLVRYIYSGEISDLSVENVHELYAAADMYAVEALKTKCGIFMAENWEAVKSNKKSKVVEREDNDCNVMENAHSYFPHIKSVLFSEEWEIFSIEHPELAQKALDFFIRNSS